MTKMVDDPTLWGRTYLYSPYKGVPPDKLLLLNVTELNSLTNRRQAFQVKQQSDIIFLRSSYGSSHRRRVKILFKSRQSVDINFETITSDNYGRWILLAETTDEVIFYWWD